MPLSVYSPNFSGLAAAAGRNTGSLGIRGVQPGMLNGLLKGMQAGKARGQQDRQFQQELALKQQAMANDQAMKQQHMDLAVEGSKLNYEKFKQQSFMDQQKLHMAKLIQEDERKIDEMGSFAAYGRLAMDRAETPDEARAVQQSIVSEAAEKGFVGEEEAEKLSTLPISKFNNALDFKILQLGKVSEYNKMRPKKESDSGEVSITRPDGTVVKVSDPSSAVKTQLQKDVLDRDQALRELKPIRENFNTNYFTFKGQAGLEASKFAEKARGIPGVEQMADYAADKLTSKTPEERAQYISDATNYLNAVERFFQQRYRKPITGAQAAVAELKQLRKSFLSGDMSPSEFQGALDGIVTNYTSESEFKKNVLNRGIDTSTIEATKAYYRDKGWSDERINAALKKVEEQ